MNLEERVNNKKVYEFAIEMYKRLKTEMYDEVFIPNITYKMVQLAFNKEIGYNIFKDYEDILVSFNYLEYIIERIDSSFAIGSIIYARTDMLKDIEEEVEEHVKKDINKWFNIVLRRLIEITKENSAFFEGTAKNIEIRSNNLTCLPKPKINDEVEQVITITENGKVNFKAYKYNGEGKKLTLARTENLVIFKGLIKIVFDNISGLFSEEYQDADDLIRKNAGEWEVKIDSEDEEYAYTGNLGRHLKYDGKNVSEIIRNIVKIENLLLFDNNKREDKINRIEVEYHRTLKRYETKNKNPEHLETLIIDRDSETLEYQKRVNDSSVKELVVTKKYKIEKVIAETLDKFDSENMFTKIEGNPKGSIEDKQDIKTYKAIITFESGKKREITGTYDKRSLPEDWENFIIEMIAMSSYFGKGDLFDNNIFNQNIRHKKDKIYLSVSLGPDEDQTYYYLTNNDDIQEADFVVIPFGPENKQILGRVEKKEYFNKLFVPYPLEKTKRIIGIYDGEIVVTESGPISDLSNIGREDKEKDKENNKNKNKEDDNLNNKKNKEKIEEGKKKDKEAKKKNKEGKNNKK